VLGMPPGIKLASRRAGNKREKYSDCQKALLDGGIFITKHSSPSGLAPETS